MSAAAVLTDALALISAPSKWAKEAVALDDRGNEVKPLSDNAKRFCMVGGLQRVQCSSTEYGEAVRHLRKACGDLSISQFNDQCSHKSMVKAMKRAIRAAEAA
ncbi:DUF6197 family protein [Rhizobium gallicum]|uniref:DUF6197 family protein n=1 Tax=Rhizobium gallicum TaxID=56730 RepID=UPI001EF79467|nr:hypothetical protein [Rhizobium gallicum]ULJ73627.1 hypothetical protein L2W42_08665 [Rhizobium gallicum]